MGEIYQLMRSGQILFFWKQAFITSLHQMPLQAIKLTESKNASDANVFAPRTSFPPTLLSASSTGLVWMEGELELPRTGSPSHKFRPADFSWPMPAFAQGHR